MELTLALQSGTTVAIACDGQPSHTFDLRSLIPDPQMLDRPPQPLDDPVAYGKVIYTALFPPGSPSRTALDLGPGRLLLVATDESLDTIPWEYAHDGTDFIVLDVPFVRGLPSEQRITPPTLDSGLHIVAVPSNPLAASVPPLNIDGEWERLAEIVRQVPAALTLERTRPPTLEQLRRQVANQRQRVIHFMGHGGQTERGAILCFEQDDGGLATVTAREFVRLVKGTVFLVTLNACVSATPGQTEFNNLAAALVRQNVPYALGMRFSVLDDDARVFSRALYSELARGVVVEEAVQQVRAALARSPRRWAIGVPVLYTALNMPSSGFNPPPGAPQVIDHQPRLDLVPVLPRAEGAFQGRVSELRTIGALLTGDNRPRVLTIHGTGGQGKTVLAREAVERFSWAWPGGVVALSLENLPIREQLIADLARFLNIDLGTFPDPVDLERQVLVRLTQQRTLVVLDNAETLIEQIEQNNVAALELVDFIRYHLQGPRVTLLVTSRTVLGWTGEVVVELSGLMPQEGRRLFRDSAPQRWIDANEPLARQLSASIDGHPLSLRLLGGAFDVSNLTLEDFITQYESELLKSEDKYRKEDHRHRNLYASINTSVRYLDDDLRNLLSGLWVFHAPFLPDLAAAVFDPDHDERGEELSPVLRLLHALWQRGLLVRTVTPRREGNLLLYRLLPTVRPYIEDERYLSQAFERESLLAQFAKACGSLVYAIYRQIDQNTMLVNVAQQCRADLERGLWLAAEEQRGAYQLYLGEILDRLGDRRAALALAEAALELSEGKDQPLELSAMNNLALVYQTIGQPQRALAFYEQALPITREVGDRASEATTLTNMAAVYQTIGQPQRALVLYEQALPIRHEVSDHAGEAATLNNMAEVYRAIGQPQRALELLGQALPIRREMGDRAGEATTLNNMGLVHYTVGQLQRALALYEQALPITREAGDRANEATTLTNIAQVCDAIGQPQRALALYEQALPIMREVSDYAGEAVTLNNMGQVHDAIGQPQRALALYEQALPIMREVGNRTGEATTLNNMGLVHYTAGQPQRALALYEQALPIMREVGNRAGEATTLNNMGLVYQTIGQPQHALAVYEQALPIMREVGNRAGEAGVLIGMAYLAMHMQQFLEALSCFEQSITLERQVGYRAGEIAGLVGVARLLYGHLGRPTDAVAHLEQALAIFEQTDLPQDVAGQTPDQVRQLRDTMRSGHRLDEPQSGSQTMPEEQLRVIAANTIAVITTMPEKHGEWREVIEQSLVDARQRGESWKIEVEFFTAVLGILDRQSSALAERHPYAAVIAAIQRGIGADVQEAEPVTNEEMQAVRAFLNADGWVATRQAVESYQAILFRPQVEIVFEQNIAGAVAEKRQIFEKYLQLLRDCKRNGIAATFDRLIANIQPELPFDVDFVLRSIAAMRGTPQEKLAYAQFLATVVAGSSDKELQQLVTTLQNALFGMPLARLGDNLSGPYRQIWEAIVLGVERERVDS